MPHYRSGRPPKGWYDKRFVEIEKVRPLVSWLERVYGGLPEVSQVTGISYRTLQGIRHPRKNKRVTKVIAQQIVDAVITLRHGSRQFSLYENEEPGRFATTAEQSLPRNFSRWRAAGGKVLK